VVTRPSTRAGNGSGGQGSVGGEGPQLNPPSFGPYRVSRFLTTSRMLRLFSQPSPRPISQDTKVVYIHGGFE
jgi:hypothetical protein